MAISCCPSKSHQASPILRRCVTCARERLNSLAKSAFLAPILETEIMAPRIRPLCHSIPMLQVVDAWPLNPQIALPFHINAAEFDHREACKKISKERKSKGLITVFEGDVGHNIPSITLSSGKKSSRPPTMDIRTWTELDFPLGDIEIDYTIDPKHPNDEKLSDETAKEVKGKNLEFAMAMMDVIADYSWIDE
ncbi:hypothetical protein IQ07DRAFT_638610 [Pyrenochaeta sp. DS3sAY3a]|nr:hypothetical protein IQ07DRAFT_638610 [Pyrenochaeta sp. DS3sAY3a]